MTASNRTKTLLRDWVPPRVIQLARNALNHIRPADWEYVSTGWDGAPLVRGWNVETVADFQKVRWKAYSQALTGTAALTINHEEPRDLVSGKLRDHNTLVTYAYVLALAARQREAVSVLDWGGGVGHYSVLSKSVLPDVKLDYYCHDVPLLCRAGRQCAPDVKFLEQRDECFLRTYDLVLASSSLWYEEDWRSLIGRLVAASNSYLYVTRMIFINRMCSYVAIQRTAADSYRTEYLCWILNQQEFVNFVCSLGMRLVREFLICEAQHIVRAPEQGTYKGFLFYRDDGK